MQGIHNDPAEAKNSHLARNWLHYYDWSDSHNNDIEKGKK
jgi:hypothetical protein